MNTVWFSDACSDSSYARHQPLLTTMTANSGSKLSTRPLQKADHYYVPPASPLCALSDVVRFGQNYPRQRRGAGALRRRSSREHEVPQQLRRLHYACWMVVTMTAGNTLEEYFGLPHVGWVKCNWNEINWINADMAADHIYCYNHPDVNHTQAWKRRHLWFCTVG